MRKRGEIIALIFVPLSFGWGWGWGGGWGGITSIFPIFSSSEDVKANQKIASAE